MLQRLSRFALRRGLRSALDFTTDAATQVTSKSFVQVFNVGVPLTVYVRASHCDVTVRRMPGAQVELSASLQAAFGWEFVTDQDEAGVYIVARRKPVVGALSRASFTISAPPEANLALHLTPGSLRLMNVDGKLDIAGA